MTTQTLKRPRHYHSKVALEHKITKLSKYTQLRYAKVRRSTKIPSEKGWPNKPYTYDQIQNHIASQLNYGVLCGFGYLAVLDADHPELAEIAESELPKTFTVKTGSGGRHFYYFTHEITKRIVLENGQIHYGEVQSRGQMIVGPGSKHPNGKWYEIQNDHPIREINQIDINSTLSKYIKPKPPPRTYQPIPSGNHQQLPHITELIDTTHFKQAPNGELYGPNPWHGSTTGKNTWINPEKNVAYCFRHQTGISPIKAMALNQGLIQTCYERIPRSSYSYLLDQFDRE